MKTIFILLPLITSNLANAYELISFSNSTVRSITQILAETHMTIEKLQNYSCENPDRMELFASTTIQNMAKDSLKILDKHENIQTYTDGKLYDSKGNLISKVKDKFTKLTLKTLKRLESIPETKQLVEELQFSPYSLYIKLGGNRYMPNNPGQRANMHGNDAGFISMLDDLRPLVDGMPFSQIGFGGFIYWNPKTVAKFVEVDYKKRRVHKDIILAHEMFHAYDGIRGLLDRRFVKSEDHEFQPVCEYRAVRLENIVREAMGYKYRRYYSDPYTVHSPQDMLDDQDEPIIMPAPCVSWL